MKYKAILLDIDNTLYDYNAANAVAKANVLHYAQIELNVTEREADNAFHKARKQIHIELSETASSHNRLLYFQRMVELLGVNPMHHALEIYNIYWDSFLAAMQPFEGAADLLKKYKNNICLLTDLTAHIQYRKIKKLGLSAYTSKLVTSEEAGREKPHPYMFMLALQKLGLKPGDVCMIGDSYKKDVFGATNLGIKTVWFNHENKQESYNSDLVTEVKTFKEILDLV